MIFWLWRELSENAIGIALSYFGFNSSPPTHTTSPLWHETSIFCFYTCDYSLIIITLLHILSHYFLPSFLSSELRYKLHILDLVLLRTSSSNSNIWLEKAGGGVFRVAIKHQTGTWSPGEAYQIMIPPKGLILASKDYMGRRGNKLWVLCR